MAFMSGCVSILADPKGRMRIPSKFRNELGGKNDSIYALINSNGCISIISNTKAQEIIEKLSQVMSIAVTEKSRAARLILASITELKEDGQGRFTLPSNLKKFANISKNVVFAGVGNSLELWDEGRWDELNNVINDPDEFKTAISSLQDVVII